MRFGTATARPFQRPPRAPSQRDIQDHTRRGKLAPQRSRRGRGRVATQGRPAQISTRLPFNRAASLPSIKRINPPPQAHNNDATTSKICSERASSSARAQPSQTRSCQPTSKMLKSIITQISAIHFRQSQIRRVRCNTFLSGYQLPWSPSRCLNLATTFMGSLFCIRQFISPQGSSLFATHAYHKSPTGAT